MDCPKCGRTPRAGALECLGCGIIFEKYQARRAARAARPDGDSPLGIWLRELFWEMRPHENPVILGARALLWLGLVIWSLSFMAATIESNYAGRSFMHLINLPFHEAGHIFFRPFGDFTASLGGTLGQMLMPLICLVVLLFKTRDPFGAAVALWWLGQNFFDIAPYVNDARTLSLPLLGGNYGHSSPYGFHDWEFILTESGLIQYDHAIARGCVALGSVIFILALSWAAALIYQQYRNR